MKYLVSIVISLALFLVFRPNHHYTLRTWFYLLLTHSPVPALMFALETTRKIKIHPVICFVATWIGGLALGFGRSQGSAAEYDAARQVFKSERTDHAPVSLMG